MTPCHNEGMSSGTTRGCWKLGEIGCPGVSWSEQLDDKELHKAPGSARESERILVFSTTSPARASSSATECGILISKDCVSVVVPL